MTRDESGSPATRRSRFGSWLAIVAVAGLTACGDGDGGDKPASQVAAKVNKEELSVHQLNFLLQQQRGVKPEQADTVSRQLLERLIDQELAIQKAGELRVDRDPAVLQRLEAARREIVSRAYMEKVGSGAAAPTPAEITAFYQSRPALFKERRVYNIQEFSIEATPAEVEQLRSRLQASKTSAEFVDHLRASGLRVSGRQLTRAAEQLPLSELDSIAALKDGQTLLLPSPTGARFLVLVGSRSQPVEESQAAPAIAQFLLNERKRKLIEEDLKSLRAAAQIEYVGTYAQSASAAAAARAAEAASAAIVLPESVAVPSPSLPAASALDAGSIVGGMGLKGSGKTVDEAPVAAPAASGPLDVKSLESGMGLK